MCKLGFKMVEFKTAAVVAIFQNGKIENNKFKTASMVAIL